MQSQMGPNSHGRSTNCNDPASIQSRVFVGNVNTFEMPAEAIKNIFSKYGAISGLSVHKGFCFVQYTNPTDAHKAIAGENGKTYSGSRIECKAAIDGRAKRDAAGQLRSAASRGANVGGGSMSAGGVASAAKRGRQGNETGLMPLPSATPLRMTGGGDSLKRHNLVPLVGQSSGEQRQQSPAQRAFAGRVDAARPQRAAPAWTPTPNGAARKEPQQRPRERDQSNDRNRRQQPGDGYRARTMAGANGHTAPAVGRAGDAGARSGVAATGLDGDILLCGVCRSLFSDVAQLLEHKRLRCELRAPCVCNSRPADATAPGRSPSSAATPACTSSSPVSLTCAVCLETLPGAWELLEHHQQKHDANLMVPIAAASEPTDEQASAADESAHERPSECSHGEQSSSAAGDDEWRDEGKQVATGGDADGDDCEAHIVIEADDEHRLLDEDDDADAPAALQSALGTSDADADNLYGDITTDPLTGRIVVAAAPGCDAAAS